MINILEISNTLGLGGTEKTMQIFCKFLDKDKFKVFAAGFLSGGVREEEIRKQSAELLIAEGSEEKIIGFIRKNNIKVVHWHSLPVAKGEIREKALRILYFCKSNGIRIIETSPFSVFNDEIDKLLDMKLFVSQVSLLKYFIKYRSRLEDKRKYGYLYNPIDISELNRYRLSQAQLYEKRRELGIGSQDYVIGKIGRANIWKWDDAILDIVPYLSRKIDNFKIVIRAIPPAKIGRIKKEYLDKFIFLPESVSEKDVCETYQILDVVLHTSRIGESFGIAISEAMYFGKPIITDSTDFRRFTFYDRDNAQVEMIKQGKNGFIANTLEEMADKLLLLYLDKNLYQKISCNNEERVSRSFDANLISNQLERMIESGDVSSGEQMTIQDYNKLVPKEGIWPLISNNVKAVYERLFY